MSYLPWHSYVMILSAFAAIAGLLILLADRKPDSSDPDGTNRVLLMMSFAYWLVHCGAIGIQKLILPEWEWVLASVRLTGVFSYLLTASCIISLPLHQVSLRQPE